MRTMYKTVFIILLGIFLADNNSLAQEVTSSVDKPKLPGANISEEQLAILKANRAEQIEFRNAFRETLTGNQLDILTNPKLTGEDKIRSFRASLSDNQIVMIKTNRKQVRSQNYFLRTTFSDQQRLQIRRMEQKRAQQNRALFQRARTRNRFPR